MAKGSAHVYRKIKRDFCRRYGVDDKEVYSPAYLLIDCLAQKYAALMYFREHEHRIPTQEREVEYQALMRSIESSITQLEKLVGSRPTASTSQETPDAEEGAVAEFYPAEAEAPEA
jgi:hypothetical protein